MLGHWTNNIMGEVISKITGVQNDSKRIAEDTESESQPLKKRKMNSISKKLADSTLSYVFGNAFNLPKNHCHWMKSQKYKASNIYLRIYLNFWTKKV